MLRCHLIMVINNKYEHPVLQFDQINMEGVFVDLLKFSAKDPGVFCFSLVKPAKGWKQLNFDASSWQKGKAVLGRKSERI
jgi:hypothetical protein